MRYAKLLASLLAIFLGSWVTAYAATIIITNTTDTIDTFRTNVNTSLTNLNGSLNGIVSTSSPLVAGQVLYATGVATMAGVATTTLSAANASLSTTGTIGALVGGTNSTFALNLGNPNAWASVQTFSAPLGIGSTTPFYSFSVGTGPSAFYISTSTGEVVGYDQTNGWSGRISPTHAFNLKWATSTTWTATTSGAYAVVDTLGMPFAGTLRTIQCSASTTASFLGIAPYIANVATTPSYFVASSTKGTITLTGNNTFNKGDALGMYVGTTTTDANATAGYCTFLVTETP